MGNQEPNSELHGIIAVGVVGGTIVMVIIFITILLVRHINKMSFSKEGSNDPLSPQSPQYETIPMSSFAKALDDTVIHPNISSAAINTSDITIQHNSCNNDGRELKISVSQHCYEKIDEVIEEYKRRKVNNDTLTVENESDPSCSMEGGPTYAQQHLHTVKMEDDPAYAQRCTVKMDTYAVTMENDPAYAQRHNGKVKGDPTYVKQYTVKIKDNPNSGLCHTKRMEDDPAHTENTVKMGVKVDNVLTYAVTMENDPACAQRHNGKVKGDPTYVKHYTVNIKDNPTTGLCHTKRMEDDPAHTENTVKMGVKVDNDLTYAVTIENDPAYAQRHSGKVEGDPTNVKHHTVKMEDKPTSGQCHTRMEDDPAHGLWYTKKTAKMGGNPPNGLTREIVAESL